MSLFVQVIKFLPSSGKIRKMSPCYQRSIQMMVDVKCHNKVVRNPKIDTDYSKNMGAVDIVYQYLGDYFIPKRKETY